MAEDRKERDCEFCKLLYELYEGTSKEPRQYWIATELFVLFHGSDTCPAAQGELMSELPKGLSQEDCLTVRRGFYVFQELQWKNAIYPNPGSNLEYPLKGLVSEVGELFGKLKKNERDGSGEITAELVVTLEKEVGDILWYLQAICAELGTSLGKCATENLVKIYGRIERGTIHGDGDDR